VSTFDVVVVGGGIVGTATAFELGRAGARTLLVDRADPGRATDAGGALTGGSLATDDDAGVAPPVAEQAATRIAIKPSPHRRLVVCMVRGSSR